MDRVYRLTKKEIGDAIVGYIGANAEGMLCYPFRIKETDCVELPDSIDFVLEYVPKGSKLGEYPHKL